MGVSSKLSVSNQQLRRPPTPLQSPISYVCEPGQRPGTARCSANVGDLAGGRRVSIRPAPRDWPGSGRVSPGLRGISQPEDGPRRRRRHCPIVDRGSPAAAPADVGRSRTAPAWPAAPRNRPASAHERRAGRRQPGAPEAPPAGGYGRLGEHGPARLSWRRRGASTGAASVAIPIGVTSSRHGAPFLSLSRTASQRQARARPGRARSGNGQSGRRARLARRRRCPPSPIGGRGPRQAPRQASARPKDPASRTEFLGPPGWAIRGDKSLRTAPGPPLARNGPARPGTAPPARISTARPGKPPPREGRSAARKRAAVPAVTGGPRRLRLGLSRRRRRRLAASDSAFAARPGSGRSARARRPCAPGSGRALPECRRLRPACTAARAAWADCRANRRQCKPQPTIRPPRDRPACGRRNSTRAVAARSARGPPGVPSGLALLFARPGSAPARHARPGAYGYPFYGDTRQVSRRR